MKIILPVIVLFTIVTLPQLVFAANYLHYDVEAKCEPAKHFIHAKTNISIPQAVVTDDLTFYLHGNLEIVDTSSNIKISEPEKIEGARIPVNKYSIKVLKKYFEFLEITITYEGEIYHPIKQLGDQYSQGMAVSPGIISDEGVVISGGSLWVPYFEDKLLTFNMKVQLPEKWVAVSQGNRDESDDENVSIWYSQEPMDEIYLIAAKFTEYEIMAGKVKIMGFLRTPDDALANKYLETTKQYLTMYENLIGKYPYEKFALIENFWETGYGMPSFTLLGPTIIRFPFILHSSYPHELLHNWWGNSVYVDYENGNWCEGFTVYLADHLINEQKNEGVQYRKTVLQNFTNYVTPQTDFPLSKFRSRYDNASSSIGYGKSMFLFHMLRQKFGDKAFIKSIQKFYKNNKFKYASFADIKKAFEEITNKKLDKFFTQWVENTGAPEIFLKNAKVVEKDKLYQLSFALTQNQTDKIFALNIPIHIYLNGSTAPIVKIVEMNEQKVEYSFDFEKPVLRIEVDPQFDVFRKLHHKEIPPSLSKIFGAEKILVVLPSKAKEELLIGYKKLATTWAHGSNDKFEIVLDTDITELPSDKAIWIFGSDNLFAKIISDGIVSYGAKLDDSVFKMNDSEITAENSIIASIRNPKNPSQVVVLLSTNNSKAFAGLARKLPHYGKYSYLAFEGGAPDNILKGIWIEHDTPLKFDFSTTTEMKNHEFKNPKRFALAKLPPAFSKEDILKTVKYLESDELEGRGIKTKGLDLAAKYITDKFKEIGLTPAGDDKSYEQKFTAKIDDVEYKLKNIIAKIQGQNKELENMPVIITAHYDHLGLGEVNCPEENKGKIHPGADDNASGIAVMLEIAKKFAKSKPERTIIFIAFSGEEHCRLGSKFYVNSLNQKMLDGIVGVVNLDTVGRLGEKKLLVLGGNSAREWKFVFMGIEYLTGIGIEMLTAELDCSDQVSFIEKGIPGIQLFTGAHTDFHKPTDTFDKIDGDGLVKIAVVTFQVVEFLASRTIPLTKTITKKTDDKPAEKPVKKPAGRVGTGIVPDFSFTGKGVKVAEVSADSPAKTAGLQKGDVIVKIGEISVENLMEYSQALKTFKPGDETTIEFLRSGEKMSCKITLAAR